jgi:hypothetical protein
LADSVEWRTIKLIDVERDEKFGERSRTTTSGCKRSLIGDRRQYLLVGCGEHDPKQGDHDRYPDQLAALRPQL